MPQIELVSSRFGNAHAYVQHEDQRVSIAEADEIRPGEWWIARVMVQEKHRGQGLGSKLLNALINECRASGARRIEVAPGGYGADPERQRAFYQRAGFIQVNPEGLMALEVPPETP